MYNTRSNLGSKSRVQRAVEESLLGEFSKVLMEDGSEGWVR